VSVCLDSWAVLAWLDGEQPAYRRVEAALRDRPLMSWINAAEAYYCVERDHGRREADEVLAGLRESLELELPGTRRMIEAARLEAAHAIALADCFAIATAMAHDMPLLTGDPEMLAIEGLDCRVEDLR
jgi:predicted nucleic acid-binding protein